MYRVYVRWPLIKSLACLLAACIVHCIPVLGVGACVSNDGFIIVLVLHIRNLVILHNLSIADISGVVHRSHFLNLERLRTGQSTGPQPTILIIARGALEVITVVNKSLLVSCIAGKVVVQTAVAGHVACDEELLAGRKMANSALRRIGVAP
ncbi:hypothetical protein HG530_001903 [Fusarium avenaceum]|nr:hypothetical protein HG530_001903 [Fusarium avenaceum]